MVREGAGVGKPPNCTDFTAELGVSRRTVARDLDFLRDEERAPLEYDDARHGFRLTDETYALPPVSTGQTFTRPADFNAETYAKQAFGIVGGEAPIKVRLLFEPKLAVYITERDWHPSQEFQTHADGRVELRLETTGRKELVRWILSWMPDVKVLAPKSLRDRIAEKLRDGLRAQE